MNSDLFEECEQSFYRELYQMDRPGQSVVLNETDGKIYVRKILKIYDPAVYKYLMEHRNQHIPEIYHVWEKNGTLTVIEEYIQGDTLDVIMSRGGLSFDEKKDMLIQLCDAMIFLHSALPPIIHRDIKPENIMLTKGGGLILIDYNAAKFYHHEKSSDTVLLGTEGSAAPEQYGFRQSDARTDIYAAGVLIKRMFPEDQGDMRAIADKATQMEPALRYQTARGLKQAIREAREAGPFRHYERAGASDYGPAPAAGPEKAGPARGINIPGFRSRTGWKMVLAVLCYISFTYIGLGILVSDKDSAFFNIITGLTYFSICFCLLDLFTDWTHLYRRIPLLRSRNIWLRLLGYAVTSAIIIFAFIFLAAIVLIVAGY